MRQESQPRGVTDFSHDRDRIRSEMADEIQCWLHSVLMYMKRRPKFAHPTGSEVLSLSKAWQILIISWKYQITTQKLKKYTKIFIKGIKPETVSCHLLNKRLVSAWILSAAPVLHLKKNIIKMDNNYSLFLIVQNLPRSKSNYQETCSTQTRNRDFSHNAQLSWSAQCYRIPWVPKTYMLLKSD